MRLIKFLGVSTLLGLGLASPAMAAAPDPTTGNARPKVRYVKRLPYGAGRNRHTGKPHEHKRAIARRTTKAGSPERAAAFAALKR